MTINAFKRLREVAYLETSGVVSEQDQRKFISDLQEMHPIFRQARSARTMDGRPCLEIEGGTEIKEAYKALEQHGWKKTGTWHRDGEFDDFPLYTLDGRWPMKLWLLAPHRIQIQAPEDSAQPPDTFPALTETTEPPDLTGIPGLDPTGEDTGGDPNPNGGGDENGPFDANGQPLDGGQPVPQPGQDPQQTQDPNAPPADPNAPASGKPGENEQFQQKPAEGEESPGITPNDGGSEQPAVGEDDGAGAVPEGGEGEVEEDQSDNIDPDKLAEMDPDDIPADDVDGGEGEAPADGEENGEEPVNPNGETPAAPTEGEEAPADGVPGEEQPEDTSVPPTSEDDAADDPAPTDTPPATDGEPAPAPVDGEETDEGAEPVAEDSEDADEGESAPDAAPAVDPKLAKDPDYPKYLELKKKFEGMSEDGSEDEDEDDDFPESDDEEEDDDDDEDKGFTKKPPQFEKTEKKPVMEDAAIKRLKEYATLANQSQAKRFLESVGLHPTKVGKVFDDYISFNLSRDSREDEVVNTLSEALGRSPIKTSKDYGPQIHRITKTIQWVWDVPGKGVIVLYPALMRVAFMNKLEDAKGEA